MRQREEARFSAKKLQFLRALPPSRATRRNGWQSSHARARARATRAKRGRWRQLLYKTHVDKPTAQAQDSRKHYQTYKGILSRRGGAG